MGLTKMMYYFLLITDTVISFVEYMSSIAVEYPYRVTIWDENNIIRIDRKNVEMWFTTIPNNRKEVRKILQQKSWLGGYIKRCILQKKTRKLKHILSIRYNMSMSNFIDIYDIAETSIATLSDDIVRLKDKYDKLTRLGDVS